MKHIFLRVCCNEMDMLSVSRQNMTDISWQWMKIQAMTFVHVVSLLHTKAMTSCRIHLLLLHWGSVNPIALRMAKTLWSFGRSKCNRVNSMTCCVIHLLLLHWGSVNPIALRMAKTLWSFGHSECNRVNTMTCCVIHLLLLHWCSVNPIALRMAKTL